MNINMDNETHNTSDPVSSGPNAASHIPENTGDIPDIITAAETPIVPEVKAPPAWKAYRIRGYVIAIAVSIILLYAFNNLLSIYVPWIPSDFSRFFWNILNNVYNHVEIPFISKAYIQCLWAINIALTFSIMGNFFLMVFRPRWFQNLIRAIIFGSGILAAYVIYVLYPFKVDSAAINNSIKAILIVGIVGLSAGVIFSLVKCVLSYKKDRPLPEIKVQPAVYPVQPESTDKPAE
jgi:hypothetical protein